VASSGRGTGNTIPVPRVLLVEDGEDIQNMVAFRLKIEAGRALGATYLTKPFVATALLNAVERACAETDGW
jgi:CheY-like chemotaxis protein